MRVEGELWAWLASRNDYCLPSLGFVAGQAARFHGDLVTLIETVPAGSVRNQGSLSRELRLHCSGAVQNSRALSSPHKP